MTKLALSTPQQKGSIRPRPFAALLHPDSGWLALSSLHPGRLFAPVYAHHCRQDMLGDLTTTMFQHAVSRQRPLPGLIHHSDRRRQYATAAFQQCLSAWGVTPSMSRKGTPYDNALAECFVATLKTESFGGLIPTNQIRRQADDLRLYRNLL